MARALPTWTAQPIPKQCYASFAEWPSNKMAGHVGSGACIHFVNQGELRSACIRTTQTWKESSSRMCFRAQLCGNYARNWNRNWTHTISSSRISIFLSQLVQNVFGHWNLHSISFLITYVAERFVGTNVRNKCFLCKECNIVFRCQKIGSCDWTGESNLNITTAARISKYFIALSTKRLRSLKSTFY